MKFRDIFVVVAVLIGTAAVQAQSAGDFILSVGWNHFRTPNGNQQVGDTTYYNDKDKVYPNEDKLTLSDADVFSLTGTYFFTDHIASELTLSTPARFDMDGVDIHSLANLSSIRQRNASLLLKYYFFNAQEKLRPYVGVGISRVLFDDECLKEGNANMIMAYHTSFENKWAPILNGGFSYQFNKHWVGSLSISYMLLKTTATTNSYMIFPNNPETDPYLARNKTQIKLNPVITQLSIGYRF